MESSTLHFLTSKGYNPQNIAINVKNLNPTEIIAWQNKIRLNEEEYNHIQKRKYFEFVCSSLNFYPTKYN